MKCQSEGCNQDAMECHYSKVEDGEFVDYYEYFCETHAVENGYCKVCGAYAAVYTCFDQCGICAFCKADTQAVNDDYGNAIIEDRG